MCIDIMYTYVAEKECSVVHIKRCNFSSDDNFVKCGPIVIILSLLYSEMNCKETSWNKLCRLVYKVIICTLDVK